MARAPSLRVLTEVFARVHPKRAAHVAPPSSPADGVCVCIDLGATVWAESEPASTAGEFFAGVLRALSYAFGVGCGHFGPPSCSTDLENGPRRPRSRNCGVPVLACWRQQGR